MVDVSICLIGLAATAFNAYEFLQTGRNPLILRSFLWLGGAFLDIEQGVGSCPDEGFFAVSLQDYPSVQDPSLFAVI